MIYFYRNIYLGETFTSYVSLRNDSTETCQKIALRCDLQTATQRIPLYPGTSGEHASSVNNFLSGNSIDHVLNHEVLHQLRRNLTRQVQR